MSQGDLPTPVTASEFIRTSELGPVRAGMLLEGVIAIWGQPTEYHLSRPPACSYGPVWIGYSYPRDKSGGRDRRVTHAALMIRDLHHPGPPGFVFDLPIDSKDAVTGALAAIGLHATRAEDLMYAGEPEVVLRVEESGIEMVFDEAGVLSCVAMPLPKVD
jgi:hypothetical protein